MDAGKNALLIRAVVFLAAVVATAVVAIPAWRTHTTRAHITQALHAADGAKLVVMEAAITRGGLGQLKEGDLAYNGGNANNPYVARLAFSATGHITVVTRNTGAAANPVLELVPVEAASAQGPSPIEWRCQVVSGDAHAVPKDCFVPPSTGADTLNRLAPAASVTP